MCRAVSRERHRAAILLRGDALRVRQPCGREAVRVDLELILERIGAEVLVDDVIEAMRRLGPVRVSVLPGREENIEFRLPAQLAAS